MKKDMHKILVVDDDYTHYILTREQLNSFNVEVVYASCGSEAIENCIKDDQISLVLMDVKMKGMNGFETALHIKGFRKNLPILFQTAFAKEFNKDELMKSIGNGYMLKPIGKELLISEIMKFIPLTRISGSENKKDKKIKTILSFVMANLF